MADRAIISFHPKGFWQGDLYLDASHLTGHEMECMGLSPDNFFTLSRTDTLEDAKRTVSEHWPDAQVVIIDPAECDLEDEEE